jgi:hypothetical protein
MDNRVISIQSNGRKAFDLAFQLLFEDGCLTHMRATHYFEHPTNGLVLLWYEDKDHNAIKLPVPLSWKESADLAWTWLQKQPKEKYQEYLDHDGDNIKAFKVYNETWTHVAGSHYGILGVIPIWGWIGK